MDMIGLFIENDTVWMQPAFEVVVPLSENDQGGLRKYREVYAAGTAVLKIVTKEEPKLMRREEDPARIDAALPRRIGCALARRL